MHIEWLGEKTQIADVKIKQCDVKIRLILILIAMVSAGACNAYFARNQYINAALQSEVFVLVSPVRQSVSSCYLNNGAPPQSNRDAGIGVPKSFIVTRMKRITINPDGVLQVDFDEEIGKVAMYFSPAAAMSKSLISRSSTSDSIERAVLDKLRLSCHRDSLSKATQRAAVFEHNPSVIVSSE